ncbi:MAG: hypothetical protein R3F62_16515 [Planctomycetota bacterium]
MVELRGELGFATHALQALRGRALGEQLERDLASAAALAGEEHAPHAALAQDLQGFEAAREFVGELLHTDHGRRSSSSAHVAPHTTAGGV